MCAYNPVAFDPIGYDVTTSALHVYTWDNSYWIPLKCVIEIYDNTGNTLLLSYDMFNPETNPVKLLECTVSLGLTNTQFTLKFEDGQGTINQNNIGLGNKILVYAGRSSDNLTLLFTGYSENRTPRIISDHVMDYEMSGYGENASLNDLIVNFKRASSQLTEIDDPNFPKRPDSKMVVHELVRDLFEDTDVRVAKDIILKDYLGLDISGISPLVTERLLSIVQGMTEVSQVLNFLTEVTGAYWKIENGKLFFEYPETQHSGIVIKNKVSNTDLANSTSYFLGSWQYTDSISKDNGFANRIYTTTSTDTKSVANSMTNNGATALFDRAIAVQVSLLETRVNTLALIMSKIGDPFTPLSDEEEISRGGLPTNPPPPPPSTCPSGYHLENGQCVPDTEPVVCPIGYHFDTVSQRCVPDSSTPVCPTGYHFDTTLQHCVLNTGQPPPPTMDVQIMGFMGDTDGSAPQGMYQNMKSKGAARFGHMGDVSYSSNASTQLGYITNNLGFTKDNMACSIGNHDHPNESGSQGVLDAVADYFGLPTNTYCQSRKWQNVYIIAMNTQDSNFDSTSSAQYVFVKSELETATALKAQGTINWIIVLIHKPFYIGSGNNHPADEEGGRSIYQALFDQHQVDIVFHGHNHNIDIHKPLKSGGTVLATVTNNVYDFTQPHGQFYATIGTGGRGKYSVSMSANNIYTNDNDNAYCLLTFNNTGLICQFQVFTASGSALTEFTISKQGDTIPPPPGTPICPSGYHWDTNIQQCVLDTTPPLGSGGGINITAALNFIKNSYKSTVQMLEEAPGFNVFWLWNDQLLGQICLKHIDPALANTVENKMNSFGVTMRTPWATLDPQYRNNFSVKIATEPTIQAGPPAIRYSDYNGASEFSVTTHADIAFLSCIHHFYTGNLTLARQAYDAGRAFWNGQGMADAGNITGEYAIYKIALGMLAERLTGFTPSIGIPDNFFAPFQHTNGGIITDKTGGSPSGSQNIETTAAVLFAVRPSLLSPPTAPTTPTCPTGYHWDPTIARCVRDVVTPPPPTTATLYRFISWGDDDTTTASSQVKTQFMTETDVAQYLFVGDGPYSTSGTAWVNMMNTFFTADKKAKLMMSQGNHEHPESESQQAEDDLEAYMPGLHNANEGLEWLVSRKVGNVFIISMNSQDPNIDQIGGTQYNWVQARLNEAKTLRASGDIDWIICMVHKSWFNMLGSNQAYVTARHAYAAMFRDAQVDFMLHGHNHNTALWKPIVAIEGNDDNQGGTPVFTLATNGAYDFSKDHGVMYIVNGHGGHEHNTFGDAPSSNVLFSNDTDYGYTVIDIQGKQATVKCKDVGGTVMYTTNVTRDGTTAPPPPTCPTGYHWDTTLQQCVQDDPPTGGEGEIDSYGIKWLVARGQQFVVVQSRDEATDDRWSGNNTGLRNGIEQTMIARSHGTSGDAHFASKLFGGNHSGSGASSQRWYDLGIRQNGEVQLQWEGPHPSNHDFTLPDTKFFIKNIGKNLENNWIGLKWCVQTIVTNGSPANGGVRCRMWVDTDPINTATNRPNNNWRLCFDFIDGIDVQVIDPQSYQAPDEQDCEIRRSDTNSHDVYGTGTIVTGSGEGDPGLHLRRMGTSVQNFADLPDYLKADFMRRQKKKAQLVTNKDENVGKPCTAQTGSRTAKPIITNYIKETNMIVNEEIKQDNKENIIQRSEETGLSFDNKIVQSEVQIAEQVVKGEIRLDNENKPTGPVISQFKVEVGSLSSTADTIFVNDVKVDAAVLSPNGKYWLVLLPCGQSYRDTILWHHDGDMTTLEKYSAFAKGSTRNDLSDWQVSRYGPTYCHAVFARLRRIQEYSDPQSIQTFRLKEDMAEADFLDDSLSVAKLMQNVLAIRGKPVRKYDLNEVTLPAGKWFTPGQNVTIVDDTGHHEESKNIFAEIQEVTYSWSTSAADSTIGTFRTKVLPVGHLNWHKELFPAGD